MSIKDRMIHSVRAECETRNNRNMMAVMMMITVMIVMTKHNGMR